MSFDEVHVAVIDESTNTVVERLTYLSKLSDAKTPEGSSAYWKDYVNEYSGYIYAGAGLSSSEVTTAGEDPGAAAASYGATAAAPLNSLESYLPQVVLYLVVLMTMHTLLVKSKQHMTYS